MATEIERKFLVRNFDEIEYDTSADFWQGYLAKNGKCSVRVRIEGDCGVTLTVKSANAGMSRFEAEFDPDSSFECLPGTMETNLKILEGNIKALKGLCSYSLNKTRYYCDVYNQISKKFDTWEIDKYHDELKGLVTAEIEMPSEDYEFEKPSWVDEEVTSIGDFYNASLAQNKTWPGRLEIKCGTSK